MTGLGIRLYTDEDVNVQLVQQLQRRGYDILGCAEAGNASQQRDDEWQLSFATAVGRAILIHNIKHYAVLHQAWAAQGRAHCGVLAVKKMTPIGELIRRTQRHLDTVLPAQQYNTWLYLAPEA